MFASCTPGSLSANGAATPPYIGQTGNCTANGSQGTPPYTYWWWQESSTGVTFYIFDGSYESSTNSRAQTVNFNFTSQLPGNSLWHCTITDAMGMQAVGSVSIHANGG